MTEVGEARFVEHHDGRDDYREWVEAPVVERDSSSRPSVYRRDAHGHRTPAALSPTSRRPGGPGSTGTWPRSRPRASARRHPSDSPSTVKASMSGSLVGSKPAGNATHTVRAGRRGSRFHAPVGAMSTALPVPRAPPKRMATSPVEFTAVDRTDAPEPMASGVATLHGALPLCHSASRECRPPTLARARTVVVPAVDCTRSTVVAAPRSAPPSVSPTLRHPEAVRVNRPTRPSRRHPVAISGAPLGRSVAPSSPSTPQSRDTLLSVGRSHERRPGREANRPAQCPAPAYKCDRAHRRDAVAVGEGVGQGGQCSGEERWDPGSPAVRALGEWGEAQQLAGEDTHQGGAGGG